MLRHLAETITGIQKDSPVLIGINGVDASGKSVFAKELGQELRSSQRHIIEASIDNFHHPKEFRYKRGRNSPEGFYRDSFNYEALIDTLLNPLSPEGNLQYKTEAFDHLKDMEVVLPTEKAEKDSILIMEGIFLFGSELIDYWDLTIFLDVDFDTILKRTIQRERDQYYLGSQEKIIEKYKQRYMPGQQLYFEEVHPKEKADIVIDNSDFEKPVIAKECVTTRK